MLKLNVQSYSLAPFFKNLDGLQEDFISLLDSYVTPIFEGYTKRMQSETRWPAISADFFMQPYRFPGLRAWEIGNSNEHARYLIPGTKAHEITQAGHFLPASAVSGFRAVQGGVSPYAVTRSMAKKEIHIQHPGTKPDDAVLGLSERVIVEASAAVEIALSRFFSKVPRKM